MHGSDVGFWLCFFVVVLLAKLIYLDVGSCAVLTYLFSLARVEEFHDPSTRTQTGFCK